MMIRRQNKAVSLFICMALVFGLWAPAVMAAQAYNQDGFGFSGAIPVGSEPIGDNIQMIGHSNWPDGFVKTTESNNTTSFQGGVFDGQYIWLIPNVADRVIRIDKDTGEMEGFNSWPTGFNTSAHNKFSGGVYANGSVWLIPSTGNMVVKVDSNGDMTGFSNWPDGINPTDVGKFKGGTFDGQYIWMAPSSPGVQKVVKINTSNGEMTGIDGWPGGIDTGGINKFGGAVFDGTHIWLIPANANQVVKIHKDTGVMTGYSDWPSDLIRNSYGNFQGGLYDGEYVYLVPSEASKMVKVASDGTMSTVVGSVKGYNGGAYDGASIWMAPLSTSAVQRYDIVSGDITTYSSTGATPGFNSWPAGLLGSSNRFIGGVFDGESVWIIPNSANMVVQIKTAVMAPDLTATLSPLGSFTTGQTGASYSVIVTNSGTAVTSDAVTVQHTVPVGLTATDISGPGWDCDLLSASCSRADALAAGSSYPAITVTVDVAEQTGGATVTPAAAVDGGGETNSSNNTAQSTINVLHTYTIGLSQTGELAFPRATVRYAPITGQDITISRTGTGDIHNLGVSIVESPSHFTVTGPALTTLDGTTPDTAFTVTPDHGLAAGTYRNTVRITANNGISQSFEVVFTVSPATSGSGGGSGPSPDVIKVRVEDTDVSAGSVVIEVDIRRTTQANGSKHDEVVLTAEQAKQIASSMKTSGSTAASIVIPDERDEVAELNVRVPKAAKQSIEDAGIDFGITTDHVKVVIPHASWQGFGDDLYFKFVPIKSEDDKQQIQARASNEATVTVALGSNELTVLGRPMTIQTNMQNRPVQLIMPLPNNKFSAAELDNLRIYIEHSDGTKELLQGVPVAFNSKGDLGLQFTVNKFSTFSIVHAKVIPPVSIQHTAYMQGYSDGTFRPDRVVTRAEMAAILARAVVLAESAPDRTYTDIASAHWASSSIAKATRMGLMQGYGDGSFGADKAISRAEMAVLIDRWLGHSSTAGTGFTDIAGHWAESAILKVHGAGIVSGYRGGEFRPDQPVTRAETVVMMNRALGREPLAQFGELPWSDVPASYWAVLDIAEASIDHPHKE